MDLTKVTQHVSGRMKTRTQSVCTQTSTPHAALWREKGKKEKEKNLFQAHT